MNTCAEFRVLITGGDGFVAPYAAKAILGSIKDAQILYTARRAMQPPPGCAFAELDILDVGAVIRTMGECKPTHILHLAGIANRSAAEENPAAAWDVNVVATLRLAHELKTQCPGATFIFVSSSQVYAGNISGLISETSPLGPQGVYASTKAAADLALGAMASDALRVVRFRPFNHTGPGQTSAYAFGSFAEQIAAIEAGLRPPLMKVGNLAAKRDFLDVRDVADAYSNAITQSSNLPHDNVFNLASGNAQKIEVLLKSMLTQSSAKIEVHFDPNLWRSAELEVIVGDSEAARTALNWNPTRPIKKTLQEMLHSARARIYDK